MNPKGPRKARFERIFAQGRRFNGETLRVSVLPGHGLVGIATSKKIGEKPQRTRLKRRLREAWRATSALPEWDVILIGGEKAFRVPYVRLLDEVAKVKRTILEQDGA